MTYEIRYAVQGFQDRLNGLLDFLESVEEVLEGANPLDKSMALSEMDGAADRLSLRLDKIRSE